MNPQGKAKELYLKMEATIWGFEVLSEKPKAIAKQCAIIAVDEIIEYLPRKKTNTHLWYWKEVKQEIKKL